VIPDLGPAFLDPRRDAEGSRARIDQFEEVCVAPLYRTPPERPPADLCGWIQKADQVIRTNNAKAGREEAP